MSASLKRALATSASAALLTVAIAGCGGGGGSPQSNQPAPPQEIVLSHLTPGYLAEAGTVEIEAGGQSDHGDIRFSCASGGDDCTVMVMVAADGTITAKSTGGEVTADDAGTPNHPDDVALDDVIGMGLNQSMAPGLDASGAPRDGSGFQEMTGADAADINDWDYTVYGLDTLASGMTAVSTERLRIYRNTDYETDTPFSDVYPLDFDIDSDTRNDSLDVASFNPSLIDGSSLLTTWSADETRPGTFDGASGMYTCESSCTLTFDANGNTIALSGAMYFTPDVGATVPAPDPDYLYFGYWLRESTDSAGDPDFDTAAVYGGEEASVFDDVQQLWGKATYNGAATGLYLRRWTDNDGDVVRRRIGQFRADATLEANFGGPTVAEIDHFSISGTISNFMDGDRAVDADWRLELGRADFGAGSSAANGIFYGPTQDVDADDDPIKKTAGMGGWEGQFFGEVDVDTDSTVDGNQSELPSGVVGAFDGQFGNGVVIGAFGAETQK